MTHSHVGNPRFRVRPSSIATNLLPLRGPCRTIDPVVSRLARPAFLIPLVVILILLAAGAWFWLRAGSSTPVSEATALEEFGEGGSRTTVGPRSGVWTYRATGDETVSIGPFDVDRTLPPEARIVVRPAPGGYWRTLAFSEEHVEASRLRVTPRGQYLEERVTTVRVAGIGRDDRQVLVPPPLTIPRVLRVGMTWAERYSLDEVKVEAAVRVLRREPVRVGDSDVPAFVIRTTADITGPFPGTRVDEVWWSPALSMPVRWKLDMDISGIASLRTTADITMTAPPPPS